MIVKLSSRSYALVSRKGKTLGVHPSRAAAEAQEIAINISKARRAGHRIPRVTTSASARNSPRRHRRSSGSARGRK